MANKEVRREEYSSSNVVRTLHPSRPLSPVRRNVEYNNNNLDDLLDDLHATVTRTAEHLDAAKARDVQYLKPQNTTTVVKERAVSPPRNGRKVYESTRFEYSESSTGPNGKPVPPLKSYESVGPANINQLDNLLDDLKQERDFSFDKENNIDLNGTNTHIIKTSHKSGQTKSVNRELKFDSPSLLSSTTHESRMRQRSHSPNVQERLESQSLRDISYDTEPIVTTTPNSTISRSYNYSKKSSSSRNVVPYKPDIVEMDTTDLPVELRNAPISSDLLPGPGTKVTTTVKTFTYEIPNDTKVPTNKNFTYKNEFYNSLNSSSKHYSDYPERDIPPPTKQTTILNESHNTINRTNNIYGPNPNHSPPELGPNQTYFYKREINETKNNIYGPPPPKSPPAVTKTTSLYERNTTNTRNVHHPPGGIPVYPNNANLPPPGQPGIKQTYLYKKETSNTTNTIYEPERYQEPEPEPPVSDIYYKCTTSTSSKTTGNLPGEREPLIAPFPTEKVIPTQVDGTPKNLGQLMASFDDTGKVVDDEPYVPRKEVNTALTSNKSEPIIEPKVQTKNIAGPPVYYPPGQELFSKGEAQAAWKAKGGYAKGSGKYDYEAESKSKSASKSGAAVVPVCLPLCCAMPCSIM